LALRGLVISDRQNPNPRNAKEDLAKMPVLDDFQE